MKTDDRHPADGALRQTRYIGPHGQAVEYLALASLH